MSDGVFVYMVRCTDGSFYTGTARGGLERRIAEHNSGHFRGYTATRRPVKLVFSQHFEHAADAISAERQIKGWSRAKKAALADGDVDALSALSRRRGPHGSRRGASPRSSP